MQPDLTPFIERGVAIKLEGVEGQDSAPDVAVDGVLLFDGSFSTQFDKKERTPDRTFFGSSTFAVANKQGYIEGGFEVFAPAAPGQTVNGFPACHPLLLIGGMASVKDPVLNTTTYHPVSKNIPSATAHWWQSDQFLGLLGTRNDVRSLKMEIGQICMGKAHILGNYDKLVDDDMPAIDTYETVPVTMSYDISTCEISVDGGSTWIPLWAKSLEIIFNSKLAAKEYTSIKKNKISGRTSTFNLLIAKTENGDDGLGDFNPIWHRDHATIVHVRMRTYETGNFGVQSGLYTEFSARGQLDQVNPANTDDDFTWQISGNCVPSSAGGDEFQVQFGLNTFTVNGSYTGGVHGVAQTFTPTAAGAYTGPVAWSATGLPAGLVINGATGAITGTVVAASGPFTVVVTATDANAAFPQVAHKTYTLTFT